MPFVHPTAEDLTAFETALTLSPPPLRVVPSDDGHVPPPPSSRRTSFVVPSPATSDKRNTRCTSKIVIDEQTFEFPIPSSQSPARPPRPFSNAHALSYKSQSSTDLPRDYSQAVYNSRRRSAPPHVCTCFPPPDSQDREASSPYPPKRQPSNILVQPYTANHPYGPPSPLLSPVSPSESSSTSFPPSPRTPTHASSSFLEMEDHVPFRARISSWGFSSSPRKESRPTPVESPSPTFTNPWPLPSPVTAAAHTPRRASSESQDWHHVDALVLVPSPKRGGAPALWADSRRKSFLHLPHTSGLLERDDPFTVLQGAKGEKRKAAARFFRTLGASWRGPRS